MFLVLALNRGAASNSLGGNFALVLLSVVYVLHLLLLFDAVPAAINTVPAGIQS